MLPVVVLISCKILVTDEHGDTRSDSGAQEVEIERF